MVVAFLILPKFLAAQVAAPLHQSKLVVQVERPPLFRKPDKLTPPGRTVLGICHKIAEELL